MTHQVCAVLEAFNAMRQVIAPPIIADAALSGTVVLPFIIKQKKATPEGTASIQYSFDLISCDTPPHLRYPASHCSLDAVAELALDADVVLQLPDAAPVALLPQA